MPVMEIPESECPYCGIPNNKIDIEEGFDPPTDGDVIHCYNCEGLIIIVGDGIRKATREEVESAIKKANAFRFDNRNKVG